MTQRLRQSDKAALDAAIAANHQPRAQKGSKGLLLSIPNAKARKLMDGKTGSLTAAGKYYYEKIAQEPPNRGFDYGQAPTRVGTRVQATLWDGSKATVRTWDGVRRQWRFTKAGKDYYKDSVDRYVVSFPTKLIHMKNGQQVWERGSALKSTATPLGEISLSTLMPEEEQLAEVKRRAQAFLDSLSTAHDGNAILLDAADSDSQNIVLLDSSQAIQYNKEHIDIRPNGESTVSATLHRPLRAGKPWNFGFAGVCPEAYRESDGRCVQKQLEALTKEQNVEKDLDIIYRELYGGDHDENPYLIETEDGATIRYDWREAGVTCAMIQSFAARRSLPVHILWDKTKILSYRPDNASGGGLCLYVFGDHAFFVDDPHTKSVLAKMKSRKREPAPEAVLAVLCKNETPPSKEWQHWNGSMEPGHYYTDDIGKARLELHAQGTCPKVSLNGVGAPKALRIPAGKEEVVVHRWPREGNVCEAFADELYRRTKRKVPYKGESLASFANVVLTELLKPPSHRKQLGEEAYNVLWCRQNRRCKTCGAKSATMNVDHIAPRFVGGGDELDNLQIICSNCHAQKTAVEALSFVEDEHPLLSRFSLETHKVFVESPKPPQLVADFRVRQGGGIGIDVIRCRFNALVETGRELPIFAPTDEFVLTTPGTLGDYHWVHISLDKRRSPQSLQPYTGARWYGRACVEYLLDAGIAMWEDIKLTYTAVARRPGEFLAERLKVMDEIWTAVGESFIGQDFLESRGSKDARSLAKYASSALFGVWGCTEHNRYKLITTSCEDDVLASSCSVSNTPGSPMEGTVSVFKDYITKQRCLELTSMRPIHQMCLEQEHLQVAKAQLLARLYCDPRNIYSIRVDEVTVQAPKNKVPAFLEKINNVTYAELPNVLPPGRVRKLQPALGSDAKVYRTRFITDEPLTAAGPLELRDAEAPILQELPWLTMEEPLGGPDDFTAQILAHVQAGHSMFVEGLAGTGKTVVLRAVNEALEHLGCQAICLTHTGARNIGPDACTAHSFVMKHVLHGTFSGQVVVIDEVSFLSLPLIAALEHLRLKGVRLMCFGDFAQLPPVSNRWRGQSVPPDVFEHSKLLRQWSDCNRFVLRRCRRSDQAHFDFYSQLRLRSVDDALSASLKQYPEKAAKCDWNIVLSHHKRKSINEQLQKTAAAKHKGPKIAINGEVPFQCFVGTKLIGCNSTLRGIVNGAFLEVIAVQGDKIRLRDEDNPKAEEFEVSPAQLAKHTRLRWALTLCSVQGRSLTGTIGIHDWKSQHFDHTHLYVALSRATCGQNVQMIP